MRDELQRDTFVVEVVNFDPDGDNEIVGTGYLSFTPLLVPGRKIEKTIDLRFEGQSAGNVLLEGEFVSSEPEK